MNTVNTLEMTVLRVNCLVSNLLLDLARHGIDYKTIKSIEDTINTDAIYMIVPAIEYSYSDITESISDCFAKLYEQLPRITTKTSFLQDLENIERVLLQGLENYITDESF